MSEDLLFNTPPTWQEIWRGMPEFNQRDKTALQSLIVNFASHEDRRKFSELVGQPITENTRSIWFPPQEIGRYANKRYEAENPAMPRYPIFIPSKSRPDTRYTMKSFDKIGVPYFVVVEPQERDAYAAVIDPARLIVLPFSNRGLVATRNWIWDYAVDLKLPRFWTFDDNIKGFYRLNENLKVPASDGTMFYAIEDFVERYENIPIAGCNYFMFASRKKAIPPFVLNTRVYSNMLIQTDISDAEGKPFRNEGFYNDDTDLCLRILKAGFCTILFNAFLIKKSTTMTVKGGMTEHYTADGRYKMAKELAEKHPDCVHITEKFGRPQHHVNYKLFAGNKLKLKPGVNLESTPNNYNMKLKILEGV